MKKNECIVHIGMHKTGSSSIQQSLHNNLEHKNISYLNLISPNHSGKIFSLFSQNRIGYVHKTQNLTQQQRDVIKTKRKVLLLENITNSDKNIQIISGEGILKLTKDELEDFKAFLSHYFEKITIVGYIRTPKSFMESAFQQIVKGSMNQFNIERCYPNYYERFEKFDIVFGRENVNLWKFDPKQFPNGNVVMDFSERLGLQMKEEETIRVNESLSREALSLIYMYRKYGPGYGIGKGVIKENKNLIESVRKIGTTKVKFAYSLISPILEKNHKDIVWMEERLGESLDENIESSNSDIQSEDDILNVDDSIVRELIAMITSDDVVSENNGNNAKEIASLMHGLRVQVNEKKYNNNGEEEMKLIELTAKVKEAQKVKLEKMNDKKLSLIIREVLRQVNMEIGNSKEERIKIPVLGTFRSKMVKRKVDDKMVSQKHTVFKASELKSKV